MNYRKSLKERLVQKTHQYLIENESNFNVSSFKITSITVDYTPKLELGHYSSNVAMKLAKPLKKKPREIADALKTFFQGDSFFESYIQRIEIAGAGFLNFFFNKNIFDFFFQQNFSLEKWIKASFEENSHHPIRNIHFEFISANPTGPLNIVSARSAAIGDSICRVFARTKKKVFKEYYVNDFGNQVHLLGVSFAIRYLESRKVFVEIPENGYHGEYVQKILEKILEKNALPDILISSQPSQSSSKERIDNWLNEAAAFFTPLAIHSILELHKADLKEFRVEFDSFFSEKSLHENEEVEKAFELLSKTGHVYEEDGAFFFRSTTFGDDKDRVLKKKDGASTYFLSDIAYHLNKFSRGYNEVYDIWGPDHHGYIARLKGAMKATQKKDDQTKIFDILIVQQVNLVEKNEAVVMSKRLGKFHSMRDLIEKIPIDVSRYFFNSRSQSQHLNFDLELALDQSHKNPVYYIQYAHARIYSIFREYREKISKEEKAVYEDSQSIITVDFSDKELFHSSYLAKYLFKAERDKLLFELLKFIDEIDMISENMEIHKLTTYLYSLANYFTKLYHHPENRIIKLFSENNSGKEKEGLFLLRLCQITAMILEEGLDLLGIKAPQKM